MTTKTYGIYGRTTAVVRIPTGSGKAFIEVEFSRGVPNAGPNYRPATFSTSDPVTQRIMENSNLFNSLYKIYKIHTEPDAVGKAPKTPANAPASEVQNLEPLTEITTKEEVVSYLKAKGAKAVNLKDSESILKFAAKIGVSFPNVTL